MRFCTFLIALVAIIIMILTGVTLGEILAGFALLAGFGIWDTSSVKKHDGNTTISATQAMELVASANKEAEEVFYKTTSYEDFKVLLGLDTPFHYLPCRETWWMEGTNWEKAFRALSKGVSEFDFEAADNWSYQPFHLIRRKMLEKLASINPPHWGQVASVFGDSKISHAAKDCLVEGNRVAQALVLLLGVRKVEDSQLKLGPITLKGGQTPHKSWKFGKRLSGCGFEEILKTTEVRDNSYQTVANGYVYSYSGSTILTIYKGGEYHKFKVEGYRPQGDPWTIYQDGGVVISRI